MHIIMNHIEWTSSANDNYAVAEVRFADNYDGDYKPMFEWDITFNGVVVCTHLTGGHIYGGSGSDGDAVRAAETLANMFTAWLEALEHSARTGRDSENVDMFPATCLHWAENYAEEFSLDMMELKVRLDPKTEIPQVD